VDLTRHFAIFSPQCIILQRVQACCNFIGLRLYWSTTDIILCDQIISYFPHRCDESNMQSRAYGTRDSISLISYAGCLGLSPVYFSENSL